MLRRSTVIVLSLGLLGCTNAPEPPVTPSPSASTTPAQAASPDPSTAGQLSAATLPARFLGFEPAVVEPIEGEFSPNGTWVHAQEAAQIAKELLPLCGSTVPHDVPVAALSGTYRNDADAPGHGTALEFDSPPSASSWFSDYGTVLGQCQAAPTEFTTPALEVRPDLVVGQRDYAGSVWSERAWVDGEIVILLIVSGQHPLEELTQAPG